MKLASLKTVSNAHSDSIWAVAWVPATDSRSALLLTGSLDETVKLWNGDSSSSSSSSSKEELCEERSFSGHSLGVVSVAAHPSGTIAASTSLDSYVRVFDVESNATLAVLESPPSEAWLMQFHPTGAMLAVAGGGSGSVKLWNTSTWRNDASLSVLKSETGSGGAEAGGGGGGGGGKGGASSSSEKTSGKFALAVAYSVDGKLLACSTMDGTVAIFDAIRGKLLHHLEGHSMAVRSLAFSRVDPNVIFTACDDKHVRMFDAKNNGIVCAMSGHGSWVLSVDSSPDGSALASGSSDRTVRLWDLSMRASIQTVADHSDHVWGVAFRPSAAAHRVAAARLASVSDDKSINLYDFS